ncbi:hypothetical protein Misp01_83730 [Microtetraspora sp. NBRC 13810]|uniref:T6SS immunity protein Tdi1 domain-containing protein n=1 Tax=Microtetraspora sp. NBRC 13810 TaxID=3030990 RepID=UPI0024A3CFF0|nr:T6SS immunity protein Tdi1 domain-containing protein [Microtetraspora sp. NBRC 13810]GLW13245.1 hypothetical protein Misp01_83730 [Microtetraspora sp. NBRC 13810]
MNVYESFVAAFPVDTVGPAMPYGNKGMVGIPGFEELIDMGAGKSFGGGLVRIHSSAEAFRATAFIADAFPEYAGRVLPVAKDWLGRQYAVMHPVEQVLLLIEPGSGDAFEVDCGLEDLFDREMVTDPNTYLARDLFLDWKALNPGILSSGQCVGFKVPLFLGGDDSLENLEISDEEVYWSIMGQLRSAAEGHS